MQLIPTFADYIALLSLFAAVFAIMAIPFGIYLERQTKNIAEAQNSLREGFHSLKTQASAIAETVQAASSFANETLAREQFSSAIVELLISQSSTLSHRVPNYRRSMQKFDDEISETVNELLIFSSSDTERLSAFRRAANEFQTLRSFKKMQIAAEWHRDGRPEIASCMRELEAKLNTR